MSLPGIGGLLFGQEGVFSGAYEVTTGSSSVDLGKGGMIEAFGFGDAELTFGSFGSINDNSWLGHTITAIYWSSSVTRFTVTGDATAQSPVMLIDGVDQSLGAGTYNAYHGITSFDGYSALSPFGGTSIVSV